MKSRVITFLLSPLLWWQAYDDHKRAYNTWCRAKSARERQLAADATWEPFHRVFDYGLPAYIMTVVYSIALILFVSWVCYK